MKRIDTDTRQVDKHGTGRDGFRYGDPGAGVGPTEVDDTWPDHLQEEIARAIERGGVDTALDENSFEQLHRVVAQNDGLSYGYVSGFEVTEDGAPSLNGSLAPGVFYHNGRRYYVSQADIDAAGTDSPRTYTASRDTYLTVEPDDADGTTYTFRVYEATNGAAVPTISTDEVIIDVVVTNGSEITSSNTWDTFESGYPRAIVGSTTQQSDRIVPNGNTGGIGDQQGDSLGGELNEANPRYWRRVYAQERYTRDLSSVAENGRVRQYMRKATVTSGNTTYIALDYSDLGNSQCISARVHAMALRTDVTTGQSKSWQMGRLISVDNAGNFQFEGSEIRQEVTASGNADVAFAITGFGDDPFFTCTVGGAGETWEFFLYIETIISDI